MYLLGKTKGVINSINKNKTALISLNLKTASCNQKKKHGLIARAVRWLDEPDNEFGYCRIGGREQLFANTKKDLQSITWKIIRHAGRIRGGSKDFYTETRIYDLRLLRASNIHHPLSCFFMLGRLNRDSRNYRIGFTSKLSKRSLFELKRRILRRWLGGEYVFKTNVKQVRAKRMVFKSSATFLKLHAWKVKKKLRKRLFRRWNNYWIQNRMLRINYFNKTTKNRNFKIVTLAECSKSYFRDSNGYVFETDRDEIDMESEKLANTYVSHEVLNLYTNSYIHTPVSLGKYWGNLLYGDADSALYFKVQIGQTKDMPLQPQVITDWTIYEVTRRIMRQKRKAYGRKTIFTLSELAAILNPTKLKKQIGHPYHLVTPSVLPVALSAAFFGVFQNFLGFMWCEGWHLENIAQYHAFFFVNLFVVIITWVLEIFKEEQSGAHTVEIQKGFQYAILLFILSELMLFFSFFWAYFHYTLNSNSFTGGSYAPRGLVVFYWYRIPLLNTLLLLASGLSLTIAHILLVEADKLYRLKVWLKILSNVYAYRTWGKMRSRSSGYGLENAVKVLVKKDFFWSKYKGLSVLDLRTHNIRYSRDNTAVVPKIFLLKYTGYTESVVYTPVFWVIDTSLKGFVFLVYQAYEYTSSMFAINDSIYGAVFFSLTGLHGLHVFVGVMSLFTYVIVTLSRETDELYALVERENFRKIGGRNKRFIKLGTQITKVNTSYKLKYFNHRIAFDGAAWYWHFVDVVWFFVFVFVYWWGFSG